MKPLSFKHFFESVDIFGFEKEREADKPDNDSYPVRQFNVEQMMKFLLRKKVGLHEADNSNFGNEIVWGGDRPGAMKLEVDTGYTFYIQRLNYDLEGNKRWATKRIFQLNRRGLAGYEDTIACEIHDHIGEYSKHEIDYPEPKYQYLEKLTHRVSRTMRRVGNPLFIFRGIKKLNENCYHIVFELRAGGVEAPGHQRVENNVTQVSFDESTGVIRINNYNIESATGGDRKWAVQPNDLDLYYFPTQSIDEIADTLAVHFKYY